jgi:hypothetical protein
MVGWLMVGWLVDGWLLEWLELWLGRIGCSKVRVRRPKLGGWLVRGWPFGWLAWLAMVDLPTMVGWLVNQWLVWLGPVVAVVG